MAKNVPVVQDSKKDLMTASSEGLGLSGLEGFSKMDLPLPWVSLVQPTTRKAVLTSGKDAQAGTFYDSSIKTSYETLSDVVILFAKKVYKEWEATEDREGGIEEQYKLMVSFVDELSPFILTVRGTSRYQFRSFLAQLRSANVGSVADRVITITAEKREGELGKWYEMRFNIERGLTKEEKEKIDNLTKSFGGFKEEEKEDTTPAPTGEEDVSPDEIPF